MALRLTLLMLVATVAARPAVPLPEVDLAAEGGSGALNLLQGHAQKIIKRGEKRAGSAAAGSPAAAARAAAAALEEVDGFGSLGGLSLIQEKQSKIKAVSSSCENKPKARQEYSRFSAMDAALLAAADDGVEDGLAALSLLQNNLHKIKGDECRNTADKSSDGQSPVVDMAAEDANADGTVSLLQGTVKAMPHK
mmetsp:Transcript_79560/g.200097  ORF Transcript_79560/g.200097 Transcript_79560/m.200097 type:complete len:194 (+) Transcript_79560:140-721(+)